MRIGKITENALKRSVLKLIKTEFKERTGAAVGADCAFSESKKVFSSVATYALDAKEVGYYAVVKAANGLIAQGIIPDHVDVSILLSEDIEEKQLKEIVRDCIEGSKAAGIVYAGGHTAVSTAVKRPVITATCVGYKESDFSFEKPKVGQALVISKWVGLEGTALLAKEKKQELTTKYPAPFINDAIDFKEYMSVESEAAVAIKSGVSAVHDLSNGGVFAALWEMGERAGCGLKVNLKSIPLRQETVEICEFFEINPYQLLSGGALLFATDDGEKLVDDLKNAGIPASVIGFLQEGNRKDIINEDESRFLEMPQADEIHKILG
ncbi:Hydrogenase maturation factor [Butyrivibrio proteoclasticus]|uniref:Hydrogenase maturation factor n=1 Tax=Butyrivibrio proteoclasticus TaxID=43305 RepID=A0A1I5UMF6_9FIRM|nr:AIR synthase-related protein [Butyrivibrio proteoclasticus]SFP96378.1 Hydrogenase maturation factor [Butyrivibrio proteoclasticus]